MTVPVQLRQTPVPAIAPAAWYLPGGSTARWLEELTRAGLAETGTRLFIVPRSATDSSPAGLLVIPARAATSPPAGLACRLVADRLYFPLDAALHPPLTNTEIQKCCPLPVQFFHPVHGLSGYDTGSTLHLWDLLAAPDENPGYWNFARVGVQPLPELSAIILAQPPALEDIFGGAEMDIGSEPALDLPPAPDEPSNEAWNKTRSELYRLIARGVAGITRKLPHTGSRRTWVNDLEDWAGKKMQQITEQLARARHKELHRLLSLLATDPEAGLRHAIPLNNFANRGAAPPSARLGPRSLDFDPRRLGGGPADFWNIPMDVRLNLHKAYREMADREMQLGRFQRAAYIYAQLLGDLVSAAHTLKQGRLFREAALVYEEHLKNPLEAARCLAEGGLLAEACERYEKLGHWLEVANLCERMGNRAAAESALRRVVAERLGQNDIVGAAKLVEERLHNPDEALKMLQAAWPASPQAASCVGMLFQMLARLGRHEIALEQVALFSRTPLPDRLVLPLLTALSEPARNYPHETLRHQAADFSRILIARQLTRPALPADESARLVEALVRLAPHDRLLARDGNRFLAARRQAELENRRVKPPPLPGKIPVMVRRIILPEQIEWLALRSEWHSFFAVGVTENRLTLLRGIWEGAFQSVSWECAATLARNGLTFQPAGDRGHTLALAILHGKPLPSKNFPATDQFFNQSCTAGTPSWLPPQILPLVFGEDVIWSAHVAAGQAILSCHDKLGKLQRTIDVTDDLLQDAERSEKARLCVAAVGQGAAIALGNRVVLTRGDGGLKRLDLPGSVVSLVSTLPHTRQGLAITLDHGAFMHWIGSENLIELDRDISSAQGVFVPAGPLVLIAGTDALLLNVDGRGVQSTCRFKLFGERLIGLSITDSPNQFAVLGAGGELIVYGIPQ